MKITDNGERECYFVDSFKEGEKKERLSTKEKGKKCMLVENKEFEKETKCVSERERKKRRKKR